MLWGSSRNILTVSCNTTMTPGNYGVWKRTSSSLLHTRSDEFETKNSFGFCWNEGEKTIPKDFHLFFFDVPVWGFYFLLVVLATDMSPNENKRKPLIRSRAWIQTLFVLFFKQKKGWNNRTMHFAFGLFHFSDFPRQKYIVVWGRRRKITDYGQTTCFGGYFLFSFFNAVIVPSWPPSKSLPATPEELSLNGKWRGVIGARTHYQLSAIQESVQIAAEFTLPSVCWSSTCQLCGLSGQILNIPPPASFVSSSEKVPWPQVLKLYSGKSKYMGELAS